MANINLDKSRRPDSNHYKYADRHAHTLIGAPSDREPKYPDGRLHPLTGAGHTPVSLEEEATYRMAIDWTTSDDRLYNASIAAIGRFAVEHPGERVCYFAFETEPRYGYVLIGFDTLANNIRSIKRREAFAVDQRQKMLGRSDAWPHAKYFLRTPVLARKVHLGHAPL